MPHHQKLTQDEPRQWRQSYSIETEWDTGCQPCCLFFSLWGKVHFNVYYWNKVTVHHLKLCYFLMKKDNTMICGVLLNHCLTVNRIISKSVCLDTRLEEMWCQKSVHKLSSQTTVHKRRRLHQRQWWTHTILSLWTDFWHHISSRTCHEA